MSAADNFRTAMRAAGLDHAGPIIADGKLHRFRANGDHARNSWFVLHAGPPAAGAFGCWRLGVKEVWHEADANMSQADWQRVRRQWAEANAARERAQHEQRAKARATAAWILSRATPADSKHPYLINKSLRVHSGLRQWRDRLVLPLRDSDGELHNLQFIGADGAKRFLTGGRVAGCFFAQAQAGNANGVKVPLMITSKMEAALRALGFSQTQINRLTPAQAHALLAGPLNDNQPDGPLVICEGCATGASIHEATAFAVACAMSCGNLKAVAEALHAKWPKREIIVAADDDQFTEGNPGLTKATEAAQAIEAKLAVPKFVDVSTKPTDFNDLHRLEGCDAVKEQIKNPTRSTGKTKFKPGSVAAEYLGTEPAMELPIIEPPPKYLPPPLSLLPSVLRDYVLTKARSLDVDVSFVFLPFLSALAAAIGNSRNIRLKNGFVQPAILWTAIVARSGSKKSPALSASINFFHAHERELIRLNADAWAVFEKQHQAWYASSKKTRGDEPKPPPRLTCLLDDLTLAVVAPILRDNPRGALVAKDELASFLGSFGQFSKTPGGAAADVSGWLSLFNGERMILDRKTNRESHRIFNPRLSIAGCIPPSVLRGALTRDFFQRGLPARFLFAAPPPSANVWTDAEVPADLESAAAAMFNRLFALEAKKDEDGPVPEELCVAPDALEVFKAFYNRVGEHAIEAEEKEEAAWSKLTGGAGRLALVGHLAHGLDVSPVGGLIMEAAVKLAEWFGHEAERIYASFHEPPEVAVCRRLVEFIERRGREASVKEITDSFRPLKNQSERCERLLNKLAQSGEGSWTSIETGPKGGRPTRKFRLSPDPTGSPRPLNPEIPTENRGFADADTSVDGTADNKELVEEVIR